MFEEKRYWKIDHIFKRLCCFLQYSSPATLVDFHPDEEQKKLIHYAIFFVKNFQFRFQSYERQIFLSIFFQFSEMEILINFEGWKDSISICFTASSSNGKDNRKLLFFLTVGGIFSRNIEFCCQMKCERMFLLVNYS